MYAVFRKFDSHDPVFYGWTGSKAVLKVLFKQRSPDKYMVIDFDRMEELEHFCNAKTYDYSEYQIDFIELKTHNGEKVKFLMTEEELVESEKRIQRYFRDLTKIIDWPRATVNTFKTYVMLDDYYIAALNYIGFIPAELSYLFDKAGYRDLTYTDDDDTEYLIEMSHLRNIHPGEEDKVKLEVLGGHSKLDDDYQTMIYSMESFIKVLKDDL